MPRPAGAFSVFPSSINEKGDVAGSYSVYDEAGRNQGMRAFMWSKTGGIIDLSQNLGTDKTSFATDIDDLGRVAGVVYTAGIGQPFVWGDSMSILTRPARSSGVVLANGRIAGQTFVEGNQWYQIPYRLDLESGRLQELPTSSGYGGAVTDMNDAGEAVGYDGYNGGMGGEGDAVMWDSSGKRTTVYACEQYRVCAFATLSSINRHGTAIGVAHSYDGAPKMFRWSRSNGVEFIKLPEGVSTFLWAQIHDDGSILLIGISSVYKLSPSGLASRLPFPVTLNGRPIEITAANSAGTLVGRIY